MFGKPLLNFQNLQLSQKFTLFLIPIFIVGIALSGVALSGVLQYNARHQIASEAKLLIETMSSLRDYTSTQVNPELVDRLQTEFLPQSVPAYSAREVFENLRQKSPWREYFYKEATLNPTNLRNKADLTEAEIVEQFRQNKTLEESRGFYRTAGGRLFYVARPLTVTKASCLDCHSTPDKAPKSQIDRYGSANGFGWKLNETVGAQIIYVPARQVFQRARQSLVLILGIVMAVFAAAIVLVNLWLKRSVIQPLTRMTRVAETVSTGDMNAEFEPVANDEVGKLAAAFTRMKTSLAIAMKRLEKYRNSQ
jgi:HAMP domain-containing protein